MTRLLELLWVIAANNRSNKMTNAEMKKEFEAYYAELKAEANADGYKVNKAFEWESFKEHLATLQE